MSQNWRSIHLLAIAESRRAHRDLDIDVSQPIDPFRALQRSGVLVMRQPLERLSGAYLPADSTNGNQPGVLINVHHPLSKQRYTAAHELCHHRRDRDINFDAETEWMPRGQHHHSDRERLAESFASWFLMPRELVRSTIDYLGLDMASIDDQDAYTLSLELGTSYLATVRHLSAMSLIDASARNRLLRVPPQTIKRSLIDKDVTLDPRSDVRIVGLGRPFRSVHVTEGDLVRFDMNETPSSGYIWQLVEHSDFVSLRQDEFLALSRYSLGGSGLHRFTVAIEGVGHHRIQVGLSRPWQSDEPIEAHDIDVEAVAKPTPGIYDPMLLVRTAA